MQREPSWSYLYKMMIPVIVNQDFKVIALDLVSISKVTKPIFEFLRPKYHKLYLFYFIHSFVIFTPFLDYFLRIDFFLFELLYAL